MDLETLKDKLDGETFGALKTYVAGILTKATDAEDKARLARKESEDGRKTLKANLATALEKLGIDSPDELDGLPDARGQADKAAQYETQIKRLTRERDEAIKASTDALGQITAAKRDKAIADAVAQHGFIDAESASVLIGARVKQEGDEFMFEADGKLLPIKDGAALLARSKPFLVKPAGVGAGSGFTGNGSGGGSANPWSPKSFNVTEQMRIKREDPARAEALKSAASAAQ